jgi:hypothetical protein
LNRIVSHIKSHRITSNKTPSRNSFSKQKRFPFKDTHSSFKPFYQKHYTNLHINDIMLVLLAVRLPLEDYYGKNVVIYDQ